MYFLVESEKQSGMVGGRCRQTNMRGLGDAGSERWAGQALMPSVVKQNFWVDDVFSSRAFIGM